MSASSILAPAQTPANSSVVTVVSGTPAYLALYTDTGVPVPDGVSLDVLRQTLEGSYLPFYIETLGRVTLNSAMTVIELAMPGSYMVKRPNITEFLVNVGVEQDS
jgi:hypothetical protein